MQFWKWLGLLVLAIALSGCTGTIYHSGRMGDNIDTISMGARQRVVVSNHVGKRTVISKDETRVTEPQDVFCAEPAPDVMTAISANFGAGVNIPANVKADVASQLAESAVNIGVRTQTIQLLRDGLYRACEAYMNGAISHTEYQLIVKGYGDAMITLVAIEAIAPPPLVTGQKIVAGNMTTTVSTTAVDPKKPQNSKTVTKVPAAGDSKSTVEVTSGSNSTVTLETNAATVGDGKPYQPGASRQVSEQVAGQIKEVLKSYFNHKEKIYNGQKKGEVRPRNTGQKQSRSTGKPGNGAKAEASDVNDAREVSSGIAGKIHEILVDFFNHKETMLSQVHNPVPRN